MIDREQLISDLKFLISFAPAMSPDEVEEGLGGMFYITGSYRGDVDLAKRVEEIMTRYGVDPDEMYNEDEEEGEDGI